MKTTVVKTLMPREINPGLLRLAKVIARKTHKLTRHGDDVFDFKLTMRTGRSYARGVPIDGKPLYRCKLEEEEGVLEQDDFDAFEARLSKLVGKVLTKHGLWVGVDLACNYDWDGTMLAEISVSFIDTNQRHIRYMFIL